MAKIKLFPNKARVKGNLITEWGTSQKDPYYFEKFHCDVSYLKKQKIKDVTLATYKITPKGEPITMTLTTGATTQISQENDIVTITATLTDQNKVPVVEQEIRIIENNILLDQQVTNANGQIKYEYTNNESGTHTLTFYTLTQNGYSPVKQDIKIKTLYKSTLTLNPYKENILKGDSINMKLHLTGEDKKPIQTQPLSIFEGEHNITPKGLKPTNQNGFSNFWYEEPKTLGHGTEISVIMPEFTRYDTEKIIGFVYDKQTQTKVTNGIVSLYMDYNTDEPITTTLTDGTFEIPLTLNDINKHKLHFYYNGYGSSTTDRDKFYDVYTPCVHYEEVTALPAPLIQVSASVNSLYLGSITTLSVNVSDPENPSFDWRNNFVTFQIRLYKEGLSENEGWGNITKIPLTSSGLARYNFTKKTQNGIFQVRAILEKSKIYSETISHEYAEIEFKPKILKVISSAPKTIPYTISSNNTTSYLEFNVKSSVTNNNNPVEGIVLYYYLDNETNACLLGTATTDKNGLINVTVNYNQNVTLGKHTLITKFIKGKTPYSNTTTTQEVIITKRTRTITIQPPTDVLPDVDFTITGTITTGTNIKLYNTPIKITNGTTTKTVTSDQNGKFNSKWNLSKSGNYTFTLLIDETEYYTQTKKTIQVNVIDLEKPETTFNSIEAIKGKSTILTAKVPSDATGTFSFIMKTSDGTNKTIITGLKQKNGVISFTTQWQGYTAGQYTYAVTYSGDNKYAPYLSAYKVLNIADAFNITCYNLTESNNITTTAGTILELTGTVINQFNKEYNGGIELWINNTKSDTILCNNGKYTYFFDISAKSLIGGSIYNAKLVCRDTARGIITEKKFTLTISANSNYTISCPNSNVLLSDKTILLQTILPGDATGDITFNYNNITTNSVKATTGTLSSDKKYLTVTMEVAQIGKKGTYDYTATLTNDKKYQSKTSPVSQIYIRDKAQIIVDNIRAWSGRSVLVNVRVIDELGENFNGDITVNVNGVTSTVNINNGVGTFKLNGKDRVYSSQQVTKLQWYYYSKVNSALNITVTSYSYNIPYDCRLLCVNSQTGLSNDKFTLWKSRGIADLVVPVLYESGMTQILLDKVLQGIQSTNIQFRVHININPTYNFTSHEYYTDIEHTQNIKIWLNKILNRYSDKISGVRFTAFKLVGDNITNKQAILHNIKDTLINYLEQYQQQNNKLLIMSTEVSPSKSIGISYGQDYVDFASSFDYIVPEMYAYNYASAVPNNDPNSAEIPFVDISWYYTRYTELKEASQNNNIIPQLQIYGGQYTGTDGKKYNRASVPASQIAQQLRACVSLFDNPHYSLYYNSYLQSDFPPYSKIIDPESDDGKTETIITITTQNGTLSKSNCLTKGIPITIKAKDNTPIRGGSVTAKLAGKTLKDANGNISIVKYTENKTIYLPCDLNTFANNTNYDLQVNYSGSSEYKLKESEKTITVKLTT